MKICLNHRCKTVFDEANIEERVIDRITGEYGGRPKPCCPQCGCWEIAEAFKCDCCGEWFDHDWKETDGNRDLCPACYKKYMDEPESPYEGCTDINQVVNRMFGL